MSSTILWHGTPADVPSADIGPRPSFFEGIWLSSAQEVAAHYAGMGGWVHGFVPAAGARLLLATGRTGGPGPYAYPDAETWEVIQEHLIREERADLDAFDCLNPGRISRGSMPPLGPEGQPSWEGLLADFCEMDGTAEAILARLELDGVLQGERADLALGDRAGDPSDPVHARLIAALRRVGSTPVLTLGVLSADALVPVCRIPARQAAEAFLAGHGMPRAKAADLGRWLAMPDPDARPGMRM